MAKLYFKFGAMKCGKTRDLIKTWYNYNEKDMTVIIMKPGDDKKAGGNIQSRANEELKADYVVPKEINIYDLIANHLIYNNLDCILVDEAQFLTSRQVDELSDVVDTFDIPVLCYGLRADAFSNLFPGSKRLVELADSIQEIKMVCDCGKKAQINARILNGKITTTGDQILIGGNDTYKAMCYSCWRKALLG